MFLLFYMPRYYLESDYRTYDSKFPRIFSDNVLNFVGTNKEFKIIKIPEEASNMHFLSNEQSDRLLLQKFPNAGSKKSLWYPYSTPVSIFHLPFCALSETDTLNLILHNCERVALESRTHHCIFWEE